MMILCRRRSFGLSSHVSNVCTLSVDIFSCSIRSYRMLNENTNTTERLTLVVSVCDNDERMSLDSRHSIDSCASQFHSKRIQHDSMYRKRDTIDQQRLSVAFARH
jgi:hypothetical protein